MPSQFEVRQQRRYRELVTALAQHVVTCNLASLDVMDTDEERKAAMSDFSNYGSDQETIEMILESTLIDAAKEIRTLQSQIQFK